MSGALQALTIAAALGCGLNAGVFFAFSSFVMPALDRLGPVDAAKAMRSVSRAAVTPVFMLALFGTALLCLVLVVLSLADPGEPYAPWLLAGSALYVLGAAVMTMAFHVPRNDALERGGDWAAFAGPWTAGNHVRALAALAAAASLTLGLVTT